jgi:calcineurin-like phosphoesterase family protein
MIWFTSDTHFGHKFIIDVCNRPFKDVHDMNLSLTEKWNNIVSKNDTIYHLGDFAFGTKKLFRELKERLNGNIILIKGNHDGNNILQYNNNRQYFNEVYERLEIRLDDYFLVLDHYPLLNWHWQEKEKSINLHGHCHGNLTIKQINQYDVGVDSNNYVPISLEQIINNLKNEDRFIKK